MEPRASRDELACDRRWLRWRWGNPEGRTASPSRPAVCFARGMALRKGEAPRTPQPTGSLQPSTWLGSGSAELLGAHGGNGAAGVLEGAAEPGPRGSPFPPPV